MPSDKVEEPICLEKTNNVISIKLSGTHSPEMDARSFKRLRDAIASAHLNFILGSGFSWSAGIPTLGNRESWFTLVRAGIQRVDSDILQRAEILLKAEYFTNVLVPAVKLPPKDDQLAFVSALKSILKQRGNTSIPRRANVFTTNYDLLLENAFEQIGVPYNDGFEGRISPEFSTGSFSRILFEQSMAHEYMSQVPSINLLKMHGSLNWSRQSESSITHADARKECLSLEQRLGSLRGSQLLESVSSLVIAEEEKLETLIEIASSLSLSQVAELEDFGSYYDSHMCIVNPTKRKFSETVLELAYYELIRLYSNELDRSNALLIAFGFSFADEHILEITKRALRNPKSILVVFCHKADNLLDYQEKFTGFENVWYVVGAASEDEAAQTIDTNVVAALLNRMVFSE